MINDFKPYIDHLKSVGLRPTRQRLSICKVLFGRPDTFHFTIKKLKKIIEQNSKNRMSLATVYNTVSAFKKSGYLKEVTLKGNKTFFDTNTKNHYHFYDEDTDELLDIGNDDILLSKVPSIPNGKKVKEIEVTVRIASDSHNQK